ncbi:MAG: succinate dehydrogenase, hydrophobic membrane anchor protein [Hyphomicrobiaceae bacterium]
MEMRTPLAKVRGLGSAKNGTDHFWLQRMTAVANIFLVIFMVYLIVGLIGADHKTVKTELARPHVAILLLLLVVSGIYHMRLGMQTVIEDYIKSDGAKVFGLMLNTFFAILVGLTCVFAILKLSFGA